MANIKIELGHPIIDGMPLSFRAPCNCNEVNGIKVQWQDGEDSYFIEFTFADAHGNDLTGLGNLFAEGAMVRVVLDIPNAKAYIQNADTNAYLEGQFATKLPMPPTAKVGQIVKITEVDENGAVIATEAVDNVENGVLTGIDFSNLDNGTWTETMADGTVHNHKNTYDADGRPIAIDGVTIGW